MNPVRSLAPDLVRGHLGTTWVYIAGPLLGALLGALLEMLLVGKPTRAGTIAAQGELGADDAAR
jgi:aquaporin Z